MHDTQYSSAAPDDLQVLLQQAHRAYLVALRSTGSAALAEDAVQEAYLYVLRHPPACRGEKMVNFFLTKVHRCARDLIRGEWRRRKREQAGVELVPRLEQAPSKSACDVAWAARTALEMLPVEEREAISLCFEQGLSREEAAQILSLSKPTLIQRVDRGLVKLRRMLLDRGFAALPPAAIGDALGSLPPVPAPPALMASLERLAERGAAGAGMAGAAHEAAAAGSFGPGLLAAAAIVAVAGIAAIPVWPRGGAAGSPPARGGVAAVSQNEAAPPLPEPRRWLFNRGIPDDLNAFVWDGAWSKFTAQFGSGREPAMTHWAKLEDKMRFMPDFEPAHRPFMVTASIKAPPDARLWNVDASWHDGAEFPQSRLWRMALEFAADGPHGGAPTDSRVPERLASIVQSANGFVPLDFHAVFLGKQILFLCDQTSGGGELKRCQPGIAEYDREYPGEKIAVGVKGCVPQTLQIRFLSEAESRDYRQRFDEARKSLAGESPEAVPAEKFAPGNSRRQAR